MNRTLLLILCDFLLLNLLALTRWEKAEPTRPHQPPVPELASNAATKDQDLVEVMRLSLADERASRDALAQKLSSTESTLAQREQNLAQLQADREKIASSLAATQQAAAELNQRYTAATQDATATKEQLARIQRELAEKRSEAERQQQALATLNQQQAEARQRIENLTVAVKVAEQEKQLLRETADTLKTQVEAERADRIRVQEATTQLAQGVGQLAEKSGQLTQEIRENRPINANVLFNDYLANRVTARFVAVRAGLLGPASKEKAAATVLVTDGAKLYALMHVDDSPLSLTDTLPDWDRITVDLVHASARPTPTTSLLFLSLDPRVIAIPVEPAQAAALGVKVYPTALEPFKFPEAVLVNGSGKGYGEVGFKLDPTQPSYVRVDNRLFKRIFGDFAPSRGDLVLSKTGELLGIMVNSDYCALVNNFLPTKSLRLGEVSSQRTSEMLDALAGRKLALPQKLQ